MDLHGFTSPWNLWGLLVSFRLSLVDLYFEKKGQNKRKRKQKKRRKKERRKYEQNERIKEGIYDCFDSTRICVVSPRVVAFPELWA